MRALNVLSPGQGCYVHHTCLPAGTVGYYPRPSHNLLRCEHYPASGARLQRPRSSIGYSLVSYKGLWTACKSEFTRSLPAGEGFFRHDLRDEVRARTNPHTLTRKLNSGSVLFLTYTLVSIISAIPTKAQKAVALSDDTEDIESPKSYFDDKQFEYEMGQIPQTPRSPALKTPMTPRTVAFNKLEGKMTSKTNRDLPLRHHISMGKETYQGRA